MMDTTNTIYFFEIVHLFDTFATRRGLIAVHFAFVSQFICRSTRLNVEVVMRRNVTLLVSMRC